MDITLIFGINLFPGDGLDTGGQQKAHDSAAIECRNGKQIHYCQVHRQKCAEIKQVQNGITYSCRLPCHIGHSAHNAYGASYVRNRRLTTDQHLQAQPHRTNPVHGCLPGIRKLSAKGGFLHIEIKSKEHTIFTAVMVFQHKIVQVYQFAIALYHNVMLIFRIIVQTNDQAEIGVKIDLLTIDFHEAVAFLKAIFSINGTKILKSGNAGGDKRLARGIDDQQDHQANQEIHRRTGR